MNHRRPLLAIGACLFTAACSEVSMSKVSYPETPRGNVVEDYFGTKVADPYRWMEDLDSKQVADWVAAQNQVTFDYLAKLPQREYFRKRITELWDHPKVSIPVHEGVRYFYAKNSGLQLGRPTSARSE